MNILGKLFTFTGDTKCFRKIVDPSDQQALQSDINQFSNWTFTSCVSFSPTKCVHSNSHSWRNHYTHVSAKAYRTLGLNLVHIQVISSLYLSIVRPILTYSSLVWRPYLITDINSLERGQQCTTKYILNDFNSNYRLRLFKLNLLPLVYQYEISDLLFFIKSLKSPTASFNINSHVTFFSGTTQLTKAHKLKNSTSLNRSTRNSSFSRVPCLWNALLVFNCNLQIATIKEHLKTFMLNHFLANFDLNNSCTLHFLCPCSRY